MARWTHHLLPTIALAAALAACGAPASPPAAAPCAVELGGGVLANADNPIYKLKSSQSQPYCDLNLVTRQFEEATSWYQSQTSGGQYAPGLLDGLATYYAEPLLHETREMLAHHMREGRVVAAELSTQSPNGALWAADGSAVTLRYEVQGYALVIRQEGAAEPERITTRGNTIWLVTLVYFPEAQRWKIVEARSEQQS
jgi:hypothetical protein